MKANVFMKTAGLLCIIGFFMLTGCREGAGPADVLSGRVYDGWPQIKFKDIRILLATEKELSYRGFAVAGHEDFEKTLIIFPDISEGAVFVNRDQGYGAVKRDIKIVFLDAGMNVLKEDIMQKGEGISIAPAGARFAIEGLPVE